MNYINDKRVSLLTQSNIISNRLSPYINEIDSKYVSNMVEDIIKSHSQEINSRVMVANLNKEIIFDSFDNLKGTNIENEEMTEALKGISTANQHLTERYGRVMYVTVPIFNKGQIMGAILISTSLEDIYHNIDNTMKRFLMLSLFSLIITGLISFVFADILASPIERLIEIVKTAAQGKFNQKVKIKGNDELSNLGMAFNIMTTKLEQVDSQRREFVANVSHELRTPLSSIKILSESLIHQEEVDIEIYREFLKDIDSEVDRLNKIIDNLLYLVDLEKEKLDLDYQITYVNYLINRVISSLKPLSDKKNIELQFLEDQKIQIMLDQNKIQQTLINIIGNAIKYTPHNGRITVELYLEQNEIVIKISDNGIGIPEDELPHIFDRFYRVDKARARETGGTGLGLSIAQQIIGLHQGRIEVRSKVHIGTSVYIYLPAKDNIN